ncbi:MAG: GSCFA domain-containing protein [Spirochaetaceae bacterium]|nr:GSCFA domain-containing protein [Spirochaetaceae bacterium]
MDLYLRDSISYVNIHGPDRLIKKEARNLFLGSCFAENLYNFYKKNYIDCLFSPFGNIYNPLTLASSLSRLCIGTPLVREELFCHREMWRHFDFDSRMISTDRDEFLRIINNNLAEAHDYLKKCHYLFLTLGTSFVYRNRETEQVVNNCHKLRADNFTRENASINEMKKSMGYALESVKNFNPEIQIIITLSPVRHLRDNAVENSLSKARLRCLIDELCAQSSNMWYFPAYEIQLDQLRDYRWYDRDLSHPSPIAIDYIMNRFIHGAADDNFISYLEDMEKLNGILSHRILHHETKESVRFQKSRKLKFNQMIEKYPEMHLLKEQYKTQFPGM